MRLKLLILFNNQLEQTLELEPGEYSIGRSGDCDIVLADRSVSALHAFLSVEKNKAIVRDNESSNGVFHLGKWIEKKSFNKDFAIDIGRYELQAEILSASSMKSPGAELRRPRLHLGRDPLRKDGEADDAPAREPLESTLILPPHEERQAADAPLSPAADNPRETESTQPETGTRRETARTANEALDLTLKRTPESTTRRRSASPFSFGEDRKAPEPDDADGLELKLPRSLRPSSEEEPLLLDARSVLNEPAATPPRTQETAPDDGLDLQLPRPLRPLDEEPLLLDAKSVLPPPRTDPPAAPEVTEQPQPAAGPGPGATGGSTAAWEPRDDYPDWSDTASVAPEPAWQTPGPAAAEGRKLPPRPAPLTFDEPERTDFQSEVTLRRQPARPEPAQAQLNLHIPLRTHTTSAPAPELEPMSTAEATIPDLDTAPPSGPTPTLSTPGAEPDETFEALAQPGPVDVVAQPGEHAPEAASAREDDSLGTTDAQSNEATAAQLPPADIPFGEERPRAGIEADSDAGTTAIPDAEAALLSVAGAGSLAGVAAAKIWSQEPKEDTGAECESPAPVDLDETLPRLRGQTHEGQARARILRAPRPGRALRSDGQGSRKESVGTAQEAGEEPTWPGLAAEAPTDPADHAAPPTPSAAAEEPTFLDAQPPAAFDDDTAVSDLAAVQASDGNENAAREQAVEERRRRVAARRKEQDKKGATRAATMSAPGTADDSAFLQPRPRRSLNIRVFVPAVVFVVALIVALSVEMPMHRMFSQERERETVKRGVLLARYLAEINVEPLRRREYDAARTFPASEEEGVAYAFVVDNNGKVLAPQKSLGKFLDSPALQVALREGKLKMWPEETGKQAIFSPIQLGETRLGGVLLGYDLRLARQDRGLSLEIRALYLLGVILVMSALGSLLLLRMVLDPLVRLAEEIGISLKNRLDRIDFRAGYRELESLVEVCNRLLLTISRDADRMDGRPATEYGDTTDRRQAHESGPPPAAAPERRAAPEPREQTRPSAPTDTPEAATIPGQPADLTLEPEPKAAVEAAGPANGVRPDELDDLDKAWCLIDLDQFRIVTHNARFGKFLGDLRTAQGVHLLEAVADVAVLGAISSLVEDARPVSSAPAGPHLRVDKMPYAGAARTALFVFEENAHG